MTNSIELGWTVPILGLVISVVAVVWSTAASRAFDRRRARELANNSQH